MTPDLHSIREQYEMRDLIVAELRKGNRPDPRTHAGRVLLRALMAYGRSYGDDILDADGLRITTNADGFSTEDRSGDARLRSAASSF